MPLGLLMFLESHAGASAVFLNEFDASGFQSSPNHFQSCSARFIQLALELTDGHDANPGSAALHCEEVIIATTMAKEVDSIKFIENRLTFKSIYFRYLHRN